MNWLWWVIISLIIWLIVLIIVMPKKSKRRLLINLPDYIITSIIALIVAVVITNTIISGHDFKVESVLKNIIIDKGEIESKEIEVGRSGGYFSLEFRIISENEEETLTIKYKLSLNGKTWSEPLDANDNILINEKQLLTSRWYYRNLSIPPSAYIKFTITLGEERLGNPAKMDMSIFKHM